MCLDENNESVRLKMIELAKSGNLVSLKKLLKESESCSDYQKYVDEAMINAADYGHLEVVKYFVEEAGADPDAHICNALCVAAEQGHVDVVKYLLEHKKEKLISLFSDPMRAAAKMGQIEILKILIDHRIQEESSLNWTLITALYSGQLETAIFLWENGADCLTEMQEDAVNLYKQEKEAADKWSQLVRELNSRERLPVYWRTGNRPIAYASDKPSILGVKIMIHEPPESDVQQYLKYKKFNKGEITQ